MTAPIDTRARPGSAEIRTTRRRREAVATTPDGITLTTEIATRELDATG